MKANDALAAFAGRNDQAGDLRGGAPDGTDLFSGIEAVRFSNGSNELPTAVA